MKKLTSIPEEKTFEEMKEYKNFAAKMWAEVAALEKEARIAIENISKKTKGKKVRFSFASSCQE